MVRRVFLTLVLGVSGNVNADAGVGVRIPMKKVVSWNREVRAFVSPRCIRRGIRGRLFEKGFQIDPQTLGKGQLTDIGDPIKYVDDDLFGYLAPEKGEKEIQPSRSAPVKVSPLIALHHTEISVEFAGRFPRTDISSEAPNANPVPFEIETARWLGSMHVIISEDIGRFKKDELSKNLLDKIKKDYSNLVEEERNYYKLKKDERKKRVRSLLEILLKEGWSFPRGSEAENQPEYNYAILLLSEKFIPTPNVLKMNDDLELDLSATKEVLSLYEWNSAYIVDYKHGSLYILSKKEDKIEEESEKLSEKSLNGVIDGATNFLLPTG
ncbi:MAG: type I-B CRISPR-associated protein Cas7/Cst2/DevR [Thermoproteota archaeon]|jgi:CRISPR-associated protein Cst2|nr:MAG: type I-B CRISPR-associated protein Cas7/Cst2/DevR [Candidatus Korarchaeota archaeon]